MLTASHLDLSNEQGSKQNASDGAKLVRGGEWHAISEAPALQRDDEWGLNFHDKPKIINSTRPTFETGNLSRYIKHGSWYNGQAGPVYI